MAAFNDYNGHIIKQRSICSDLIKKNQYIHYNIILYIYYVKYQLYVLDGIKYTKLSLRSDIV